ncbi:hypothetical protein PINS_up002215 [Pythium insidiosum]|nr:hypothetical protein PINS_up002215 [Pythium insidiosum]
MSPDVGVVHHRLDHSQETTPKKKHGAPKSTGAGNSSAASTPTVRTRVKLLSPIPTSRAYASRSKTLFKANLEFCLTGFVSDGLTSLTELIQSHGGRVYDKDILVRGNSKAVVIATPVSWRKLKFMTAVACGIPVIHPEWIHACISTGTVLPFKGYCVPTGYSITSGMFSCLPVKHVNIFAGKRFGIPHDVHPSSLSHVRQMCELMPSILKICGAAEVVVDLQVTREKLVDVVIADESTKICEFFERRHHVPVQTFSWVTECIVLQRYIHPAPDEFRPQGPGTMVAAQAQIGDSENTVLKLQAGELVLVDLSNEGNIDHFLLFDVCEILSIHQHTDGGHRRKAESVKSVSLRVGVLERLPNSPALFRSQARIIDITPDKIKRRVVAVSKEDFDTMEYRDESIFYYEE